MSESQSFLSSLLDFFQRLFRPQPPPDSGVLTPLQPRVLVIIYNPSVDTDTGKRLIETMGWNDPDQLAARYIADVRECSGGLVDYQIVQRTEVDGLPVKEFGFQFTPQEYLNTARTNVGAHIQDPVDYNAIISQFNLLQRVAANEFDEVWVFGGPYFGFWESAMAGAGAFPCNGGPISKTSQCPRRFVVMGFNYERGVGEMLEDLGHRAEAVLARVFDSEAFLFWAYDRARNPKTATTSDSNLFERFLYFDQIAPGEANIGTVHYAPNSQSDYQWAVMTPVQSCADDWKQFPNLPTPPNYRMMDAREWGSGDMRAHHKWWLSHLPQVAGTTNGIANNWWKYFIDPNNVG